MLAKQEISGREYGALIAGGTLSFGLFAFPRDLAIHAGYGTIYSMVLIYLMTAAGVWAIQRLAIMMPNQTIYEYMPRILGKWLGRAALAVLTVMYIYWLSNVLLRAADTVRVQLLRDTPLVIVQFIFILVGAYLAALGIEALGRLCVVMVTPAVFFTITLYFMAWTNVERIELTPLFEGNWLGIGVGACDAFYIMLGVQLAAVYVAFVRPKDRPTAARQAFTSLTALWSLFLVVLLTTVGSLGIPVVKEMILPGIVAVNLVELSGSLIEKLGLFILVIWTVIVITNIATVTWALSMLAAKTCGMDMAKGKFLLIPLLMTAYWVSSIQPNEEVVEGIVLPIISAVAFIGVLVMPLILLLVAKLRRRSII